MKWEKGFRGIKAMKKYKVAVVGATGNVGREILNILDSRKFPTSHIYAVASSKSSRNKNYHMVMIKKYRLNL